METQKSGQRKNRGDEELNKTESTQASVKVSPIPATSPSKRAYVYFPKGINLLSDNIPSVPLRSGSTTASLDASLYNQPEVTKLYVDSSMELWEEINKLKKGRYELIKKLRETEENAVDNEAARKLLEKTNDELTKKESLDYLLSNINSEARRKLLESDDFKRLFEETTYCNSFVMSIDIRRSTDLMLKARESELFEKFIVSLCEKLSNIIIENLGIFDKFTGDGILSFFPDFYSGEDAGLMAVNAALQCHDIFEDHYKEHRNCFISVLQDTGLGIGIDYGSTYKVKMNSTLTVIGRPVVYACRMSGAKAGDTLLNQPAYDMIFKKYSKYFNFEDTTIDIKNEGPTLAYKVTSNNSEYEYSKPDWNEIIKKHKEKLEKL
jgi:class 3 adenylate cyclase